MNSTISDMGSRRPSAFNSFSLRKKDVIDILLNEKQDAYVNSYTTLDKIEGSVTMKFDKDTWFDSMSICFEGTTNTYVEKVATTAPTTGRTTGSHVFLRLIQPIDETCLPEDHQAKAGETYSIPFMFVVPEKLLPQICTHRTDHPHVHESHLHLPPSFGDPMLASDGVSLLDDLAPDMSKISYKIRVKMSRIKENGKVDVIVDKAIRVRVVPAVEEQPPLRVGEESDYELRKEKDIKKGMFKLGKIGRLTAEANQPTSLRLYAPNSKAVKPVTAMATVNLRFDPNDEADLPPKLGSLYSKLRVMTFFGAHPFRDFPTKSNITAWDTAKGLFADTLPLSQRCISEVTWQKHTESTDLGRRDSAVSNSSAFAPEPSQAYSGRTFYTAVILVPIHLPKGKAFPPTFNSCLVSRHYGLDLQVTYHTPGATVSVPSITLKIPLQISSEGNPDARPSISHAEAEAIAAREATQEMMRTYEHRPMSVPSPEYTENAHSMIPRTEHHRDMAPPGYSSFLGARHRRDEMPLPPPPSNRCPVGAGF